jgi:aspartate ammonia-lyase
VAHAASAGQVRLNATEPVIVLNILQSMRALTRGMVTLKKRCIDGIEVGVDRTLLDQSVVLATPLASLVGYSKASNLSKKALVEKSNFRDVVEEENVLTEAQNKQIFEDAAEFAGVSNNACG